MEIVAVYYQHAAECERLAARITNEDQRNAVLQIAESWRELAIQREKLLETQRRLHEDGTGPAPRAAADPVY